MAVETQKVEIYGEDGEKKRVFKTGEKAYVKIAVKNNNPFPVFYHETRVWLGSSCGDLSIEKKCYIPYLDIYGVGWCFPTFTMPASTGDYGVGGNNVDEGSTVRYCYPIEVHTPPAPGKGKLVVKTEPSEATIYIDYKKVGNSPIEVDVDPGKHRVEARKEGHLKEVEPAVNVKEDDIKTVKLGLTPLEEARNRWKKGAIAAVAGLGLGILAGVIKERAKHGKATV